MAAKIREIYLLAYLESEDSLPKLIKMDYYVVEWYEGYSNFESASFWLMLISDTTKIWDYDMEGDEPPLSRIYNNAINNLSESWDV